MKEPGFGHSATAVFFAGIFLTVLISIFMNPGGWWGGFSWFYGVIFIGFTGTSLLAALLAVIGIARDEDPTIGSGCSITSVIIIAILTMIIYFSG